MKKLLVIGVLSLAIAGYSAVHFLPIPNPKTKSDREYNEQLREYEKRYREERMLELMEQSVQNQNRDYWYR